MKSVRKALQNFFAAVLTAIAKAVLKKYKPTIIAVTGNVGKTTTKDIIASMLSAHAPTRSTIRSQNTSLTTPLSIFGIEVQNKERNPLVWLKHVWSGLFLLIRDKDFPQFLVLEVSASGPGDITEQARWIRPDISVFTALQEMPVHLEFFENRDQLFSEKMELAKYTKENGTIVYNDDDEFFPGLMKDVTKSKLPVGSQTDISLSEIEYTNRGVTADVVVRDATHHALIPGVWGDTYMQSVLLGCGVMQSLNFDITASLQQLEKDFTPIAGRMRVLKGKNDTTIIDDSYNASPIAVEAALDALQKVHATGQKFFLFGDMYELGVFEESAHRKIGVKAAGIAETILLVGEKTKITYDAIMQSGFSSLHVKHFETSDEAGFWLSGELQEGDVVLAKSSRHAIKMEQALRHIVLKDQREFLSQEYL